MDGRRRTLVLSVGLVAGMLGVVAASVPLYRLFCQVTGYGGTPRIVSSDTAQTTSQTVTIRFDSNVMADVPWRFAPEQTAMTVKLGETNLALFRAENLSNEAVTGTAVFNVTPGKAAIYVNKIQCFCFTQQRLAGGEKAEMPVSFYIDPKIANDKDTFDVKTITLSYTFYRSHNQTAGAQAAPAGSAPSTDDKKGKS
ncbi:MAG TPA: cytochrome c oxidase assembly protein [Magnetospirillaceae bacterium]|jgi:cytochrome c oxidase assembly protein subunit 11